MLETVAEVACAFGMNHQDGYVFRIAEGDHCHVYGGWVEPRNDYADTTVVVLRDEAYNCVSGPQFIALTLMEWMSK